MSKQINKPRGTRDLYGLKAKKFFGICSQIKEKIISYGYEEISTPIFEEVGVFSHNDEEQLSANKEFFFVGNKSIFENKEDDEEKKFFVLRPENTASVARMVSENKILKNNPLILSYFYCGPCFRYERPQKGRFRQFTQIGIERINSVSSLNDIENILLMEDIRKLFKGLDGKLHLNFLGSKESKKKGGDALTEHFLKNKENLTSSIERIKNNPLRILDDKVDSLSECVETAPSIDDFLTPEEQKEKLFIKKNLEALDIDYIWDNKLIRGIDYYDGLVYEGRCGDLSLASGGRYNKIFERFSDDSYPAVGLAIGIERIQEELEMMEYSGPDFYKNSIYLDLFDYLEDYEIVRAALKLCENLRRKKFSVFVNYDKQSSKRSIRMAEKMKMNGYIIPRKGSYGSFEFFVKFLLSDEKIEKNFYSTHFGPLVSFIEEQ